MNTSSIFLLLISTLSLIGASFSYTVLSTGNPTKKPEQVASTTTSRRSWLNTVIATTSAAIAGHAALATSPSSVAAATTTSSEENVYFGVGCFWHIQHEFIQAERDLLQRNDKQLTSLTGYAGGKSIGDQGQVCYHNMQSLADYGRMGHGEVVGMSLPSDQIVPFAKVYFSLYDPRTKDRVDPNDRGAEYRSLIGLPGGVNHASYADIEAAAQASGFKLKPGKGNDPDTLGQRLVFVYDTAKFPFYQAEVYHQYHNDFQSPKYGKQYNDLAQIAFEDGRIKPTGCPDRV